jgi:hypothetical protein
MNTNKRSIMSNDPRHQLEDARAREAYALSAVQVADYSAAVESADDGGYTASALVAAQDALEAAAEQLDRLGIEPAPAAGDSIGELRDCHAEAVRLRSALETNVPRLVADGILAGALPHVAPERAA